MGNSKPPASSQTPPGWLFFFFCPTLHYPKSVELSFLAAATRREDNQLPTSYKLPNLIIVIVSYKWFNELIWFKAIVSPLASLSSSCRPCQPELSQLTKDRERLEVGHTFRQQEKDKINLLPRDPSLLLLLRVTYIITLICYLTAPLLSVSSCWHILWSLFFQSHLSLPDPILCDQWTRSAIGPLSISHLRCLLWHGGRRIQPD